MEVTRYKVNARCYPRFKSETRRILDILRRTNVFWDETFGESYPTNKHDAEIETDLHNENVELFICDKNRATKISSSAGNDMVLRNEDISILGSYKYDDMETFLAEKQTSFKSTTVIIVRNNKCIRDTIKKIAGKTIIVIASSKQERCKLEKAYKKYPHVKVSSDDEVAKDICSMLERTAFEPMKDKYENVKCLLQGIRPSTPSCKIGKDVKPKFPVRNKSPSVGSTTFINGNRKRESRNGKRKMNGVSVKTLQKGHSQTSIGSNFTKRRRQNYKEEATVMQLEGNNQEMKCAKCHGRRLVCKEVSAIMRPEDENKTMYVRQTRRGKVLSTTDSVDWKSKFLKNKQKFQRLFGEMIGMYKRSKLSEDFKPSLNGIPKEEVSEKMLSDLYNISGSIKGYAYRFRTRLQIFVLEADIEKLKPKIAEILEMHGIAQGSYDIVPPVDAVTPFTKLHTGARVMSNEMNYASLTGFAELQGQQDKDICALASKHLLDGRKTVELANEKVTITADVIPETAPGDKIMKFDIAAAKVRKGDEKHCQGQFENESGTFMKGIVCSYDDDQLEGQYVHICGASTAKGKGIISLTHYEERKDNEKSNPNKGNIDNEKSSQNKDRRQSEKSNINKELTDNGESNQSKNFIFVEDRENDRFCMEGDSGSMVCADDEDGNHVQLISTVIGERETGCYQTLRLTEGIAHLEKKTKGKLSFF
ncbi:uncharacterized protein LOC123558585 [Mercenaria mercenaria]|uniref:uncharacterized protein LOC123558585 n=1 Tax=Mercenaria mercenaria TaxID=6596 RepID=UPI00234E43A4|nr:uncharacterized protein LOC123558585 [Mercenaria mercenaria]